MSGDVIDNDKDDIAISITQNKNAEQLKQAIKAAVGFSSAETSTFMARRRHLTALDKTCELIQRGLQVYKNNKSHELLADDLYQASKALSEITGVFTTDDLLGKIFAEFCIGK